MAAQDAFPEALDLLQPWLKPLNDGDYLIHQLHQTKLCSKFPQETLSFLSLLIGDQIQWPPFDLGQCLEAIRVAEPELINDQRFEKLTTYLRKHGNL